MAGGRGAGVPWVDRGLGGCGGGGWFFEEDCFSAFFERGVGEEGVLGAVGWGRICWRTTFLVFWFLPLSRTCCVESLLSSVL